MTVSHRHIVAGAALWALAAVSCVAIHQTVHIERFLLAAAITYTVCLAVSQATDRVIKHIDDRARQVFWLSHSDSDSSP